jgi:GDP-L-fucose synthase
VDKSSKVYVAGHTGMVGSAIVRRLKLEKYTNILLQDKSNLNLLHEKDVDDFFKHNKPDYVFLAAAKVGGILSNRNNPADYFYENIKIELNVLQSAFKHRVKRLCFLGSSCIYPKNANQPFREEDLLNGHIEKTNEAYAVAKIAGIKMCEFFNQQYGTDFLTTMPTNVYGIHDKFNTESNHVIPSLISKIYAAKVFDKSEFSIWGSGQSRREFINSNDLAGALVFLMESRKDNSLINIGTGEEIKIIDLAQHIKEIIGFQGKIVFDDSKPDGMPRKVVDSSKIRDLGWKPVVDLKTGLAETYSWFQKNVNKIEHVN